MGDVVTFVEIPIKPFAALEPSWKLLFGSFQEGWVEVPIKPLLARKRENLPGRGGAYVPALPLPAPRRNPNQALAGTETWIPAFAGMTGSGRNPNQALAGAET